MIRIVITAILVGANVIVGLAAESTEKAALADKKTYLGDLSTALKAKWPQNRTVNIVCHGHSVPAGYFVTPAAEPFNSYPHLFHRKVNEAFPTAVTNVIVTAIGGETSESGAARFERDVLSHRPDLVTIDYALNDRGLGLEKAKKAWSSMIELARKANVKVILMTPTADSGTKFDDPNDPLNQHAQQIRALAAEYHVGLVDSLPLYADYVKNGGKVEDLLSQANHPNRKGHELVTEELIKWLPR